MRPQALTLSRWISGSFTFGALVCLMASPSMAAPPKGLGDPGTLTGLRLEPSVDAKGIVLRGRDGRQQLFATGVFSSGQLRDLTRKVQYVAEPADVVQIDATGHMTPLKDGQVIGA